jgi:hypothetical protein
MGCSGSKCDESGRPVLGHKINPEREKNRQYYTAVMEKMEKLLEKEERIVKKYKEVDDHNTDEIYETYKAKLEKYHLTKEEFNYGMVCHYIKYDESVVIERKDVAQMLPEILKEVYNSSIRDKVKEEFVKKLKDAKFDLNYLSVYIKDVSLLEDPKLAKNALDILNFDPKYQGDALALLLSPSACNNELYLQSIANVIEFSDKLASVALILLPMEEDEYERKKGSEYCLDKFEPILNALNKNIRLRCFSLFSMLCCTYTLSDKLQKTLIEIYKKNHHLQLSSLTKFSFSEENYKMLMKYITNHKGLVGFGIERLQFNLREYDLFIETVRKSKSLKIGCFFGFENMEMADKYSAEVKDIGNKLVVLSKPLDEK